MASVWSPLRIAFWDNNRDAVGTRVQEGPSLRFWCFVPHDQWSPGPLGRNWREHGGWQALHGTSMQGGRRTSIFPAGQGWLWACVCGMYCPVGLWPSQRVALTSLGSLKPWIQAAPMKPEVGWPVGKWSFTGLTFNNQTVLHSSFLPDPEKKDSYSQDCQSFIFLFLFVK